jgi:hypothetical protein
VEVVGEAVSEDLTVLGEIVVNEDPVALGVRHGPDGGWRGTGGGPGRRSRRWGGEARMVDPSMVGEAAAVQAWRWSRSGRAGGGEMIVTRVRVYGRAGGRTLKKEEY